MLTPPRSRSRSRRCSPISRSSASDGVGVAARRARPARRRTSARAAAHGRTFAAGRDGVGLAVEVEGPEQRRTVDRRAAGWRHLRRARRGSIGARPSGRYSVSPRANASRSSGATGSDERGDVGDRVVHAVTAPLPFGVERLVEVATAGGVDGDEVRGRARRDARRAGTPGGSTGPFVAAALRFVADLDREPGGHGEVRADAVEGAGKLVRRRGEAQRRGRHRWSGRRRRVATTSSSRRRHGRDRARATNATASSMSSTTVDQVGPAEARGLSPDER